MRENACFRSVTHSGASLRGGKSRRCEKAGNPCRPARFFPDRRQHFPVQPGPRSGIRSEGENERGSSLAWTAVSRFDKLKAQSFAEGLKAPQDSEDDQNLIAARLSFRRRERMTMTRTKRGGRR